MTEVQVRRLRCLCEWGDNAAVPMAVLPTWPSVDCPVRSHSRSAKAKAAMKEHHERMVESAKVRYEEYMARYGERPYCRNMENALDGFTLHARECPRWPQSWWGTSTGCIREGGGRVR